MKRALLVTAALAMTLGSTVAQAQSYGYDRGDRREYRQERREDRREYRQDRRDDRREYRQDRRDYSRWSRGQYLSPQYRQSRYVVHDYGRYRLAPPPRGHQYYRQGNDILLTAIGTGLIGFVLGSVLNNDQPRYVQPQPYAPAAYGQYGYGQYGYAPQPGYQSTYPAYPQPYYAPR